MDEKIYYSIHGWLRRNFTKNNICEKCGKDDAKKYDWALKKGFKYEKVRNNFIELCRSCHLKYDYTKERIAKLSKSGKKSYANNPERAKTQGSSKSKKIEQYSLDNILINTFTSAREAQRETKIDISSITKCCNGKNYYKSAGGFIWKYKL